MSSSSSKYLSNVRMVVFLTTIFFSLIVMSLSANLISLTWPIYFKFSQLSLATALLSKSTVAVMLLVDIYHKGSIFSYIVVEIVWLSILWVLWLLTGSYASRTDGLLIDASLSKSNCEFGFFANSDAAQICRELKAIMDFSFLTWILLMSYTILLVVLAIRAQGRGNSPWTTGVRDGVLFYSVRKTTGGAAQVQAALATIPYSQLSPQQPQPQQPQPQQPYTPYPSSYPIAQV